MGNFSIACGAVKSSGTADRAFRVPGAQEQIEGRMRALASLAEKQMKFARKHGFVETIPDRTVDPDHGYPLMIQRTPNGRVLPTTPYTYHIQGSAMWFTLRAMTKCADRLAEWRRDHNFDAFITLQPHDELVFDFPAGKGKEPWRTNLPAAMGLKRLMESVGQDFVTPIKLEVSCEYINDNYSEGRAVA
jgi:DNA polymerase I-like protein with 3'-5' exonuclease and polymerase domains